MDVSGEAADLIIKEGVQITGEVVKMAAGGISTAAALLLAIAKENYKVVGKTSAKKLAADPTPGVVVPVKREDIPQFQKLAKEYGVLYCMAQKRGLESSTVDVISTQAYAANLNAVCQAMGYAVPQKQEQTEKAPKKAIPRSQQERSSPERGNGWNPQARTNEKPSVRGRLAALQAQQKSEKAVPVRQKEHIR